MTNRTRVAIVVLILLGLMLALVPIVLEAGFGVVALPPL